MPIPIHKADDRADLYNQSTPGSAPGQNSDEVLFDRAPDKDEEPAEIEFQTENDSPGDAQNLQDDDFGLERGKIMSSQREAKNDSLDLLGIKKKDRKFEPINKEENLSRTDRESESDLIYGEDKPLNRHIQNMKGGDLIKGAKVKTSSLKLHDTIELQGRLLKIVKADKLGVVARSLTSSFDELIEAEDVNLISKAEQIETTSGVSFDTKSVYEEAKQMLSSGKDLGSVARELADKYPGTGNDVDSIWDWLERQGLGQEASKKEAMFFQHTAAADEALFPIEDDTVHSAR